MDTQRALKAIMAAANISSRQLGECMGITPQSAANKIYNGVNRITDLIKIANACNADVIIRTNDGLEIPLTVSDESGKRENV